MRGIIASVGRKPLSDSSSNGLGEANGTVASNFLPTEVTMKECEHEFSTAGDITDATCDKCGILMIEA